jgi:hypothetical protein
MGHSDDGSRSINNRSGDAAGQLLIGRLLASRVAHPLILGSRQRVLLNGLAEADRRATQGGKGKNYKSRPKTKSHEYFFPLSYFHPDPSSFKGTRPRAPAPKV